MLTGKRTWLFKNNPVILSAAAVGGPDEAAGNIAADFDLLHDDMWLEQASFEKAQTMMMEQACDIALKKANINEKNVNFFVSGDLTNQITPTTFAARTLEIPYFGLFSACALTTESLALSAFLINGQGADYVLSGTSSHNSAAERQFRYPTEYGGQKPPTAQHTVTGAGCVLLAKQGKGPSVTSATIGKVIDMGITDPFNMGGAMAPAAVDTIVTHLKERNVDASYYDLIVTGDLGKIGHGISMELLGKQGIKLNDSNYKDCGMTIYKDDQQVQAGGSGPACAAVTTYGHFMKKIFSGKLNRVLLVATGALHSPLSMNQNDSIPVIAHAVSIENGCEQA
ncbi:stage V sporulation protein AD [Aciduricibacillus chroicocephali]|uniref:Stage V sporulation protein AD n=1 Tax=Aciduricibacillus chroicocephali TaxID=3054939 RepID=A0ABY9L168_9BACI|nr:stage V sporulation protein AD [Bacillaceae bacterium 44XB]